ncbi:MAG: hypothetical protein A2147_07500 [Chloroflexi bacterium RBG_16_57_8]|nr:MAG: hypothetical protein A2147_07500 [Chloroflexi bacterium RBG_16_57_8]
MALQPWQRNLAIICATEFGTMMAFSFVDPLLPLRIQQVGGFTTKEAAFWAGLATSGLGVVMFFVSPLWGVVADRFGRKLMVLRAMFGGAIVISLIGLAGSVYLIVGLRWLQGMLTGSVAAASALAATMTPRERLPFAIGMIMVAIFTGGSLGPFLGGIVADHLGYQATFFFSSGMLLVSGAVVLVFIKEGFHRPAKGEGVSLRSTFRLAKSREMLPLLIAMALLNFGPSMVGPLISLRVKELDPAGQAATASGLTFSLMGATAAVSSFASGRLGGRVKLATIMVFSCVMAGLLYLPPIWAGTVGALMVLLAVGGLVRGGISTTSNAMVGLSVPSGQEGIAYGLSQSASSLGGGLGPLVGGSVASAAGIRPVFGMAAVVYVFVGFYVSRFLFRKAKP